MEALRGWFTARAEGEGAAAGGAAGGAAAGAAAEEGAGALPALPEP